MGAVTVALIGFFAFLIMRVTAPQMTPLFTDLSVEDSSAIIKDLERQGIPYRDQERRRHRAGAEGPGAAAAHEARRRRPAQGRRRRLRDLRQVGRARRHELRAEHQPPARAGGRAVPHHPRDRPRAGGARASGAAGAAAVLARQGRGHRLDRAARCAARWSRSRCAPSAIWSPPRSTASSRSASRSSTKPAGCWPTARAATTRRRRRADERKVAYERRLREQVEVDRHLGGRPRPRPRAAHRRFRLQPHHPDLGQVRSGRPRRALEPDPRRIRRPATTARTARSPSATSCPARSAAGRWRRHAARPEPQDRGNRQLRDFAHHQDRGDRRRPRQPRLGRGAGRRHLRQERQGRAAYQPRDKEEIDRIAALVRTAIGFDQKRGDQVEVVNLRFAETPAQRRSNEPTGWHDVPAIHQGRHHALDRACW